MCCLCSKPSPCALRTSTAQRRRRVAWPAARTAARENSSANSHGLMPACNDGCVKSYIYGTPQIVYYRTLLVCIFQTIQMPPVCINVQSCLMTETCVINYQNPKLPPQTAYSANCQPSTANCLEGSRAGSHRDHKALPLGQWQLARSTGMSKSWGRDRAEQGGIANCQTTMENKYSIAVSGGHA